MAKKISSGSGKRDILMTIMGSDGGAISSVVLDTWDLAVVGFGADLRAACLFPIASLASGLGLGLGSEDSGDQAC